MNTKKIVILGTALAILAGLFFLSSVSSLRKHDSKNFMIGGKEVKVEMVSTSKDQRRGLGGRESLCEDCGMLFIFSEKKKESFWMKGMLFDLDLIWIADGKVSYIVKDADHFSLEKMAPDMPSDMVLEVNSGFCDKFGIEVGDETVLK